MSASNWIILSIACLIGGGIFLALHSLRRRPPSAHDTEAASDYKPPHHYDAALQALSVLGVDPDEQDNDDGSPMHRAASEGNVAVIEALCAVGENPNARDNHRRTPLHRAVYWGHTKALDAQGDRI